MQLSKKQNEYILHATHRWNIKSGAVRSGKSFVDTAYIVPFRIRERKGKPGLNAILGVSKASIERNVLQPMRELYTDKLIGTINSMNIARICGEDVYCLGAEKVSQVAKIQGSSIKYCYGDEIAKWNQDVFQMLKSRLDKPYSCFDGACNPEQPTHWLKKFIDNEELDIYLQKYTIFDNPFLPPEYVEQLCKEYEGTVWYERLILGKWKRADGAIYKRFADKSELFYCEIKDEIEGNTERREFKKTDIVSLEIGLDFGGNKSGHAFVARGYTDNYREVIGVMSRRIMVDDYPEGIDSKKLTELFLEFVQEENHSILLSSHITSDLEKVADYITFIHNGKLIMTVSKNDLVYNYAVMRCKESQFLTLDPKDILAYRKRDFQIDVLVSNGKEAQKKYKGVVVDHVSVDEIMLLLVKGERV